MQQVVSIKQDVKDGFGIRRRLGTEQRHRGYLWRLTLAAILSWSLLALFPEHAKAAFDCNSVTQIPVAECEALVTLYTSTDGPNWLRDTDWLVTTTPCGWFGVGCSPAPPPRHITVLTLSHNLLSGNVPAQLGDLSSLDTLSLGGNQLTSLPPEIGNLANLEWLDLATNQLSSLPPEFGNLTTLRGLNISRNPLTTLPAEFGNLTTLEDLNAVELPWTTLPSVITTLPNLGHLDLSQTPLTSLPPEFGNLVSLGGLVIADTPLVTLPPEFGNLVNLRDLFLYRNQLSTVPAEIGNLTNLQALYLWGNQLTSLPPGIGNLANLRQLHLQRNQLSTVPAELGNLANLLQLDLSQNQLTSLPAEFVNLTNLAILELNDNQLSTLPAAFDTLATVHELNLSNNQLSSLPQEINNMKRLRQLFLSNNQLSGDFPKIRNLTRLQDLDISVNPALIGPLPTVLVNFDELRIFYFNDTNLCEPNDAAFQAWLDDVALVQSTNLICPGSPSPLPPSSSSSVQLNLFTTEAAAGSVTLHWETEAEADNLGFNLYRMPVNGGSVTKLNATLIAAQGSAETGATYDFQDRPMGGHYIYLIKNVDQQGVEHLRGQAEVEAEGHALFVPAIAAP